MDLISNATFRIIGSAPRIREHPLGIYRIILTHPPSDLVIAVLIHPERDDATGKKGGRKRKAATTHRKKRPAPLVGTLRWLYFSDLRELEKHHVLLAIEVEPPPVRLNSKCAEDEFAKRIDVMRDFLDQRKLEDSILECHGLGGLVKAALTRTGVGKSMVYHQWSNLCRYGLSRNSLAPHFHRCGAQGVARPVDPQPKGTPSRKKAGRKPTATRIAQAFHEPAPPEQPAMSSDWADRIRAGDRQIPNPKPAFPERYKLIIDKAFSVRAKDSEGLIVGCHPKQGTYPNREQVRRVLRGMRSRIDRLIEQTTKRHFEANQRGLTGRNWQGVAGPGHTWAIDSTVGDIYLRSSINRSWIVGRPIVYIIVDVWSTAIVGFYVALTGPSWATAKVSLFNAVANPDLLGELWGYEPILALNPLPSLPYALLCDHGEYLSQGHRITALQLIPLTRYAPPYRGDLKGIVEVLHRIQKDEQFLFIPGAMDYRRKELDLRRVDPNDAIFTVREYVQYLQECFTEYNLTADRAHRLDAHMIGAGVFPSPAGLWHWGHDVGIGFRRHTPERELITELLPSQTGIVCRDAVRHAGGDYMSEEIKAAQWTTLARNFGHWEIPIRYYPGAMQTIWTPHPDTSRMLRLDIADQARVSPETTMDEWLDVLALQVMKKPDIKHQRMITSLQALRRNEKRKKDAQEKTKDALANASGPQPTFREAREMEVAAVSLPSVPEATTTAASQDDALAEHEALLQSLLQDANRQG